MCKFIHHQQWPSCWFYFTISESQRYIFCLSEVHVLAMGQGRGPLLVHSSDGPAGRDGWVRNSTYPCSHMVPPCKSHGSTKSSWRLWSSLMPLKREMERFRVSGGLNQVFLHVLSSKQIIFQGAKSYRHLPQTLYRSEFNTIQYVSPKRSSLWPLWTIVIPTQLPLGWKWDSSGRAEWSFEVQELPKAMTQIQREEAIV